MTQVSEEQWLLKLYEVVYKLSTIAKTQVYRFKKLWDEYLAPLNENPYLVRQIDLEKEKFLNNIDYRIETLQTIEHSMVDGFYTIKSLLETLYNLYLQDSDLLKRDFSAEDQVILHYFIAREIIGNLVQYNKMDHETIPLKYNIIAREYLMIKLQGISLNDVKESLKKLNKVVAEDLLIKIMEEIKQDGIINIEQREGSYFYTLNKELKFSPECEKKLNETGLRQLIDWPTQWWRSYYNIRELNVTPDDTFPYRNFLYTVLSKSATQGLGPADYVFKNLVKYYEKIKNPDA